MVNNPKKAGSKRRVAREETLSRRVLVRIREMKCKGFSCWPPAWAGRGLRLGESGVLRDVRAIQGTKRIRIDVEYEGKVFSWIIAVGQNAFTPLYQMLRTNIGESLLAIGDLEIHIVSN